MNNAQPGQSIKPSANTDAQPNETKNNDTCANVPESSKGEKRHLFTPVHETTKKLKYLNATEKMMTEMCSTMKEIKDYLVKKLTT